MNQNLKNLLIIIIIPTIAWGILSYWIYTLLVDPVSGEFILPFWMLHIIFLIGYCTSMVLLYLMVYVNTFWKKFWGKS